MIKCHNCGYGPCLCEADDRDYLSYIDHAEIKIQKLEKRNKIMENIHAWAEANIPEMDCRGDEDCDHCCGRQLLDALKQCKEVE